MGAERKKSIFLHCLGSECQVVFRALPEARPVEGEGDAHYVYKEALLRMEQRFKSVTNIALNRYKFYMRIQTETESFDEFLTALRSLSLHCNFGEMCDEIIRDQIIVHVKNKKTQERLWELGDPKLSEAISIAKALEQSEKWMLTVKNTGNSKVESSDEICVIKHTETLKHDNSVTVSSVPRVNNYGGFKKFDKNERSGVCYRCGCRMQMASYGGCPAINKECRKCGRIGHFASSCRDLRKNNTRSKLSCVSASNNVVCRHECGECSESSKGFVVYLAEGISSVTGSNSCCIKNSPMCVVEIAGINLDLMADSGSPWTII